MENLDLLHLNFFFITSVQSWKLSVCNNFLIANQNYKVSVRYNDLQRLKKRQIEVMLQCLNLNIKSGLTTIRWMTCDVAWRPQTASSRWSVFPSFRSEGCRLEGQSNFLTLASKAAVRSLL